MHTAEPDKWWLQSCDDPHLYVGAFANGPTLALANGPTLACIAGKLPNEETQKNLGGMSAAFNAAAAAPYALRRGLPRPPKAGLTDAATMLVTSSRRGFRAPRSEGRLMQQERARGRLPTGSQNAAVAERRARPAACCAFQSSSRCISVRRGSRDPRLVRREEEGCDEGREAGRGGGRKEGRCAHLHNQSLEILKPKSPSISSA